MTVLIRRLLSFYTVRLYLFEMTVTWLNSTFKMLRRSVQIRRKLRPEFEESENLDLKGTIQMKHSLKLLYDFDEEKLQIVNKSFSMTDAIMRSHQEFFRS